MGSLAHGSEELLAEEACTRIAGRKDARVLVGGLGMGYTLAAALARVGPKASVVVAELVPAVVNWNQGPLAHLAGRPLDDPRAAVFVGDVREAYTSGPWDAILIDVDNGPSGLLRGANHPLYAPAGLRAARDALRPGGVFGVWSIAPSRDFTRSLQRAGFDVEEKEARARRTRGGRHTLWIATKRREKPAGLRADRERPPGIGTNRRAQPLPSTSDPTSRRSKRHRRATDPRRRPPS